MTELTFYSETLPTPTGVMVLLTDAQDRLRVIDWADYDHRMLRLLTAQYRTPMRIDGRKGSPSPARAAMSDYFDGDLTAIDGLTTETAGTPFQRAVWKALRDIPPGQTTSYGALAAAIGRPSAVRAVGAANGANPIGVVAPVTGSSGPRHP